MTKEEFEKARGYQRTYNSLWAQLNQKLIQLIND